MKIFNFLLAMICVGGVFFTSSLAIQIACVAGAIIFFYCAAAEYIHIFLSSLSSLFRRFTE